MRGLWVEGGKLSFRSDLEDPLAGSGETTVQVLQTGVCATDLALVRGYMDFRGVPGHEFVGRALDGPHAGQRVVGEINAGCGACPSCEREASRHCSRRSVLGILGRSGAFAERLSLPHANLHVLPEDLPTDRAVFAEPLAAAFEIPAQLDLSSHSRAWVLGDGRLGLLCAQVLALHGVEVGLFGRHPERGAWLPQGIRHLGELADTSPEPRALVVEATGDPAALPRALELCRPRGTLVLKTTSEAPTRLDLARIVVDEIRLQGSRCGPFEPAIEALRLGTVAVEPMIAARFPLEEGASAFELAGRRGTLKVLVEQDGR